ncbi:MAG TPA: hypothetical protein VKZ58_10030 [Longimicrobiales bacterium]|nr:hypothetical protein [Longimicrobiales bacterium]
MDSLDKDYPAVLLAPRDGPCISIYLPTHRHHPENQQDPIRFRNQVKQAEEMLRATLSSREVDALLAPFRELADRPYFWEHTFDGLAVLGAPGYFRVYRLQRPVPERTVVADSFHTKPLLRIVQSADRYQVLGLSLGAIRLFEGNRDALDEIELAEGVPRNMTEALGENVTEAHRMVTTRGPATPAAHHGYGSKKDEMDIDQERFFRAVDRAILVHHSRPSGLPLILAALPEHHSRFRQSSHNPYLVEGAIDVHPDALSREELRARAWEVFQPRYLSRLAWLVESFGTAAAHGYGTGDVADAARAAVNGRVGTLLLEAERVVPGRMDRETGRIEYLEPGTPGADDLLDDIGEMVLARGGDVVIVPKERMPTDTGLAATYRY